jgi:iron complex transport system substrate-binding protein
VLKYIFLLLFPVLFLSCRSEKDNFSENIPEGDTLNVAYANGFSLIQYNGYKILKVKDPWPDAANIYTYLLVEEKTKIPEDIEYDHKIKIPVRRMVVTSTTHIPSLEALGEKKTLIGFPGLDYISSEEFRKLIKAGEVTELGQNEAINTEVLISLEPEVVVGFAVNGSNKTFKTIEKSGIPVIFNGDWTEESPLGKAEWIKFFGALYNKSEEAARVFEEIESSYKEAKELAGTATNIPIVLSGSMYKDQWYVPYGNSWSAQFIKDANANYLYKNTTGSGSIALAFESVLSQGQNADFWIAPGQFKSFEQLYESSTHYNQFKAVKTGNVYTYSNTSGETGGVLYYELGPTRPDIVLKDLISIFHPDLLPDYEPVFFKPLE